VNLKIDPDWQSISEIRIRDSTIDVIQTQDAIDAVRWNTGEVHRSSGRAGGPADLGASDRVLYVGLKKGWLVSLDINTAQSCVESGSREELT
jgi:hypothetical protein